MTKTLFLILTISLLTATMGFTSCKQNTKGIAATAESLMMDSLSIPVPDSTAKRMAMADSSWETAASAFTEDQQTVQDSTADGGKHKTNTIGKPKIAPLNRIDPYRPQELKDGLEKAKNGDLRGAIADFDLCIAKNYKNYNAYFYKAKALIELNEPQNALPNLNLAIENNSANAMFLYYRGKLFFEAGNTQEASADFDKAVSLQPDFADALNYRGVTKEIAGKHAEAIEDYNAAIKENPGFATAYYNKGTSEASLAQYPAAIASFSKCIELDPKKVMSFMNRGNCHIMLKDYKSAISDYTTAITIDPKNPDAYFNRGAAYHYSGDKNSCIDWEKAKSLGNKKAAELLSQYCK